MEFEKLLRELELSPELISGLAQRINSLSCLNDRILSLTDGGSQAYSELERLLGREDHMGMLACQLMAALTTRTRYREKGIGEEVFLATFRCFPRFLEETRRRTGHFRFDRGWWTWRQLGMLLFRIGELEFERLPETGDISIHIPSDADLSPEAVDRSVHKAREFFSRFYPESSGVFWCHSWLMSPVLRSLLAEDSNIRRFQERFLTGQGEFDGEDIYEWLFRVPEGTAAEALPEDTSLQRRVKALLLAGGKVGRAKGILK